MAWILRLPFLVILTGVGAVAMFLPAAHAATLGHYHTARVFLYSGVIFFMLALTVGIATSGYIPRNRARSQLAALLGAYILLPAMMAVPFHQAVQDTSFLNAWFEMVSDFTTTGATLYDTPGRLLPSLHFWRALVGWMGGFFVLLCAAAVLAPLDLGGIEVLSGKVPGRAAQGAGQIIRGADPSERLVRHTVALFPAYTGLTLMLWVLLLMSGDTGLTALSLAMSTLSTSGIVPEIPLHAGRSGIPGEVFIFIFLTFALTRRSLPGAVLTDRNRSILSDHEVRLAGFLLILVPAILFLRHWWAFLATEEMMSAGTMLGAIWGALFTTTSFLTTTGFESSDWQATRAWSGLGNPGLILMGLAMIGGGIATTAGGLKLLRVYADPPRRART